MGNSKETGKKKMSNEEKKKIEEEKLEKQQEYSSKKRSKLTDENMKEIVGGNRNAVKDYVSGLEWLMNYKNEIKMRCRDKYGDKAGVNAFTQIINELRGKSEKEAKAHIKNKWKIDCYDLI